MLKKIKLIIIISFFFYLTISICFSIEVEKLPGAVCFFNWNHDWNEYMYSKEKYIDRDIQLIKTAGLKIVRVDFTWNDIEPEKGKFQFEKYDKLLKKLETNNLKILAVLGYTPPWASDSQEYNAVPKNIKEFKKFIKKVVTRYKKSIKYWEIWNEPDIESYFLSSDWEKDYIPLLKIAYKQIKSIDSKLLVLNGGFANGPIEGIESLYKQKLKNFFDIVNVHIFMNPHDLIKRPFTNVVRMEIQSLYNLMKKYGDENKKIWITEIGCPGRNEDTIPWNPNNQKNWFIGETTNIEKQSHYIYDIFTHIINIPQVEAVFWAFFRDTRHFHTDADYLGIINWNGTPKDSYFYLKDALIKE